MVHSGKNTSDWGSQLRHLRERDGWTKSYLSSRLGVTIEDIESYERGKVRPPWSQDLATTLKSIFGIPGARLAQRLVGP